MHRLTTPELARHLVNDDRLGTRVILALAAGPLSAETLFRVLKDQGALTAYLTLHSKLMGALEDNLIIREEEMVELTPSAYYLSTLVKELILKSGQRY